MSKVKEHYMQIQQQEFELELSYQEWLMNNTTEPSGDELNEMEHDFLTKPHYDKNRIITHRPLNNTDYNSVGA